MTVMLGSPSEQVNCEDIGCILLLYLSNRRKTKGHFQYPEDNSGQQIPFPVTRLLLSYDNSVWGILFIWNTFYMNNRMNCSLQGGLCNLPKEKTNNQNNNKMLSISVHNISTSNCNFFLPCFSGWPLMQRSTSASVSLALGLKVSATPGKAVSFLINQTS